MVTTADEAIAAANRIGYPVMLKVRREDEMDGEEEGAHATTSLP